MSPADPSQTGPDTGEDNFVWQRLALMARPRATKANALAALLAILLGFAVATQVRQNQVLGLESLRQADLSSPSWTTPQGCLHAWTRTSANFKSPAMS